MFDLSLSLTLNLSQHAICQLNKLFSQLYHLGFEGMEERGLLSRFPRFRKRHVTNRFPVPRYSVVLTWVFIPLCECLLCSESRKNLCKIKHIAIKASIRCNKGCSFLRACKQKNSNYKTAWNPYLTTDYNFVLIALLEYPGRHYINPKKKGQVLSSNTSTTFMRPDSRDKALTNIF